MVVPMTHCFSGDPFRSISVHGCFHGFAYTVASWVYGFMLPIDENLIRNLRVRRFVHTHTINSEGAH